MERGSSKHGPRIDDEAQAETESIERSGKESRAEDFVEKEPTDESEGSSSGHRIHGSGSSAEEYTYKDHGEEGGASHPKPRDKDD